jgi:serine/threonine protein kinase
MGDFPPEWILVRELVEGGQAHTFVVRRSDGSDTKQYVLKRLKNLKRADRFEQEVDAYQTLDHPSILKLVAHGKTPKGNPFLIAEFCADGSLDRHEKFESPLGGLRVFEKIVAAIAYAHAQPKAVFHLDLKPENILLKDSQPIIGDFGICYVENSELTLTSFGPHGSRYYCVPELQGPKITGDPPLGAADVYSLGKILYWLFTREVYPSHEDYAEQERFLARLFPSHPEFAFIDELIQKSVRRRAAERFANADEFHQQVGRVMQRMAARGHVLDLDVPQRCLYCAEGFYHADGPQISSDERTNPYVPAGNATQAERPIFQDLRRKRNYIFGSVNDTQVGTPIVMVCDYCGNIQYFRFDLTKDKTGANWKP